MSTLDDKLREIFFQAPEEWIELHTLLEGDVWDYVECAHINPEAIPEIITKVNAALSDEGYASFSDVRANQLMTGKQWYDRFEQELRGEVFQDEHAVREAVNKCWDAAKRAANMEESA